MLMIYLTRLRDAFLPLRLALRSAQCLGGERPNYADSIVWAAFVGFAPAIKLPLLTSERFLGNRGSPVASHNPVKMNRTVL
jgi:hypothetical protein